MGNETPAVEERACPELAPLRLRPWVGGHVGPGFKRVGGQGRVRRTLNGWYLFFLQLVEILVFTV